MRCYMVLLYIRVDSELLPLERVLFFDTIAYSMYGVEYTTKVGKKFMHEYGNGSPVEYTDGVAKVKNDRYTYYTTLV